MSADQLEYNTSSDDSRWSDVFSLAGFRKLERVSGTPSCSEFRHENSDVLLEFAQRASTEMLPAIREELFQRFETIAFAERLINYEAATEGAAKYYVGIVALTRTPIQAVTAYINCFRRDSARLVMFRDYLDALLDSRQFTDAITAVDAFPVNDEQRSSLIEKVAFACISNEASICTPP